MNQPFIHWEAAEVVFEAHRNEFYDGADDPLYAAAAAYGRDLDRRIEEAGGIDAWRAQRVTAASEA